MTATTATLVKKDAETEKCVAEPPRLRSRWPKGVLIESIATEPTTNKEGILVIILSPGTAARSRHASLRARGAKRIYCDERDLFVHQRAGCATASCRRTQVISFLCSLIHRGVF